MLRSAHVIQLCVVALLGLGLVMTQSAGLRVGESSVPVASGLGDALLGRNSIYALLAIATMLGASWINVRQLFLVRGFANPLWIVVIVSLAAVALTQVPGVGRSVNGATRWLYLGPRTWGLSFQPSELIKWSGVVAIAWWCARRRGVMHRFWHGLFPPLLFVVVACGLVVVEDLGTAALIGLMMVCLLLAGGARWWHMALLVPPALAGMGALIATSPYRLRRMLAFMDPWADPMGAGYHPIQSMLAIAQGGPFGRGLGNGIQKFGYLPEDTTDFVFAIVCEEMGIGGAALVIGLILTILWFGLGVVRDCRDTFSRLVGLGVLLVFGFQAAINIAVVTAMMPTKGIALPLVSSGGTGWIMTAMALGLVAALDNGNHLEADEPRIPSTAQPVTA